MDKEVGEKYVLKHSFVINQWAAPDILLVTPPGITGEYQDNPQGDSSVVPPYLPCLTFQDGMWQYQHA